MTPKIYTSADWGYRFQLWSFVSSIDEVSGNDAIITIEVLTDSVSYTKFLSAGRKWNNVKVTYRAVEIQIFEKVPVYGHVGVMTYVRLLLDSPAICPDDYALYMDSDILVRSSLRKILDATSRLETSFGAVPEIGTYKVSNSKGVFNWRELGLPEDQIYFNAGVLGLNLGRIRKLGIFKEALEYLHVHGRNVISHDQGGLNAVARGDVTLWPVQWNFVTSALLKRNFAKVQKHWSGRQPSLDEIVVVHFTGSGSSKPWHINSTSPFTSFYQKIYCSNGGVLIANTRLEKMFGLRLAKYIRKLTKTFTYSSFN